MEYLVFPLWSLHPTLGTILEEWKGARKKLRLGHGAKDYKEEMEINIIAEGNYDGSEKGSI